MLKKLFYSSNPPIKAFPSDGSGRAGIFCGELFCCLNINSQRIELYNGSTLIGSYATEISKTPSSDLRSIQECTPLK